MYIYRARLFHGGHLALKENNYGIPLPGLRVRTRFAAMVAGFRKEVEASFGLKRFRYDIP